MLYRDSEKEQNDLVRQSKLIDTIVRRSKSRSVRANLTPKTLLPYYHEH